MKDELSAQQIEEIISSLDEMLEKGPWDASSFLKVIGKNIATIRSDFLQYVEMTDTSRQHSLFQKKESHADQQEIFISLYSSQGDKIQSWERIVANLPRQMISRPIYADEAHLKSAMRSRGNSVNEAYVAVYINKNDILAVDQDRIPVDKLGKPLLTLKDKAIALENLNRFVHLSDVYGWEGGRLIKKMVSD